MRTINKDYIWSKFSPKKRLACTKSKRKFCVEHMAGEKGGKKISLSNVTCLSTSRGQAASTQLFQPSARALANACVRGGDIGQRRPCEDTVEGKMTEAGEREGERVQRRAGPRLMRAAPRGSSDGGICLLVHDKTARGALHPLEAPGSGPDGWVEKVAQTPGPPVTGLPQWGVTVHLTVVVGVVVGSLTVLHKLWNVAVAASVSEVCQTLHKLRSRVTSGHGVPSDLPGQSVFSLLTWGVHTVGIVCILSLSSCVIFDRQTLTDCHVRKVDEPFHLICVACKPWCRLQENGNTPTWKSRS